MKIRNLRVANHNQLIVGPDSWAYQVLRQTLGERFMPKIKVTIFIDRSLIFNFTFHSTKRSRIGSLSLATVRVSVLFTHVAKADLVFALICDDKMIINHRWTNIMRETSCKKLLDKYNADPLFVREVKRSDKVDEWHFTVGVKNHPSVKISSAIPATNLSTSGVSRT